jgi:hypothetical protein
LALLVPFLLDVNLVIFTYLVFVCFCVCFVTTANAASNISECLFACARLLFSHPSFFVPVPIFERVSVTTISLLTI